MAKFKFLTVFGVPGNSHSRSFQGFPGDGSWEFPEGPTRGSDEKLMSNERTGPKVLNVIRISKRSMQYDMIVSIIMWQYIEM